MADARKLSDAQKRAQLAAEQANNRILVDEYKRVWQRLKLDLDVLAQKIRDAQTAGETVNRTWILQRQRLQALLEDVQQEISLTTAVLEHVITRAQADAVIQGQQDAADLIKAQLPPAMVFQPAFPTDAFTTLVGFAQDGQPLGDLLAELGPMAAQDVKAALVMGVATGVNPRQIAYDARTALGGNLARAMTIARTEVLRAYRESSRKTFQENTDVVTEWVWTAKLDGRTCAMCWAMNGQKFKVEQPLDSHPNCRCTLIPITKTWEELGFVGLRETRAEVPLGEDVFATQSAEVQRRVLGPSKFAAYQAGDITLQDLVQQTESKRWGAGRREASLATALDSAKAAVPTAAGIAPVAEAAIPESFASISEAQTWAEENLATKVAIRDNADLGAVHQAMSGIHAGLGGQRIDYLNMAWNGKAETIVGPTGTPYLVKGTSKALARAGYVGKFGTEKFATFLQMRASHLADPGLARKIAEDEAAAFTTQKAIQLDRIEQSIADPARAHLADYNQTKLQKLQETTRWTVGKPEDKLFTIGAHESTHVRDFLSGNAGRRAMPIGPDAKAWMVSEYAASAGEELFAEVGAMIATGEEALVPPKILQAFRDWEKSFSETSADFRAAEFNRTSARGL